MTPKMRQMSERHCSKSKFTRLRENWQNPAQCLVARGGRLVRVTTPVKFGYPVAVKVKNWNPWKLLSGASIILLYSRQPIESFWPIFDDSRSRFSTVPGPSLHFKGQSTRRKTEINCDNFRNLEYDDGNFNAGYAVWFQSGWVYYGYIDFSNKAQ